MQKQPSIVSLNTARSILIPLSKADTDFYEHLYTDDFLTQNVGGALQPDAALRAFELSLKQIDAPVFKRFTWLVVDKFSQDKIGICALVSSLREDNSADIGAILCKKYHGKGFATEILKELMTYGFVRLRLNSITGYSMLENVISSKLMKSLGYDFYIRREGKMPGYYWSMSIDGWNGHLNPIGVNS